MASVEISDDLYNKLAKLARIHERSVAEEVADLIRDLPEPLDRAEYSALLGGIRALPKFESDLDPVALIREDRDNR
jgi:predicted transcriptional regulator